MIVLIITCLVLMVYTGYLEKKIRKLNKSINELRGGSDGKSKSVDLSD